MRGKKIYNFTRKRCFETLFRLKFDTSPKSIELTSHRITANRITIPVARAM
jgi:hypothetical protein